LMHFYPFIFMSLSLLQVFLILVSWISQNI